MRPNPLMPTRTVTRNLHVVGTTVASGAARSARPRSAETLSVPGGRGPAPRRGPGTATGDALEPPPCGPRRESASGGGRGAVLLGEHVVGDDGLGVGDAQVLGPLVGHGQQPADPAGDGVLGHRRGGRPGGPPPPTPAPRARPR